MTPPAPNLRCGIGATIDGFALKLLGQDNVAVYDVGLFEWTSAPGVADDDLSNAP